MITAIFAWIASFFRKRSQLDRCRIDTSEPDIETFEYKRKLYDKKKYIDIRGERKL